MHRLVFFLVVLIATCSLYGQGKKTKRLKEWISNHKGEKIPVRIEFIDNVDCFLLNQQFKSDKTPIAERIKTVNRKLITQSIKSQQPILNFLNNRQKAGLVIKPFWIVNIIVAVLDENTIDELDQFNAIKSIHLEDNKFSTIEYDTAEQPKIQQQNGVENGLLAINARPMWDKGYTGRGRLIYNYDTGVWPTHPAFSERFIGNRYPMHQSWIGFFNSHPNGSIQNHGTHTLGTIAGLVESTNDTIGVAFKSYWIANDFVTSTVAQLPPITNMIEAFQWALNPDNDTSTTYDVPDVINNSWRWYDGGDTIHCGGFVVDLMNAIEAAGIANIFSGGNSGPNNTSVNSPQRINTSLVNTFSVGSVNGNLNFPHPISNFSTRGPTQCPGSGSLSIHPEVVAPGQNVRSAWGTDDFNTISGTSMAAPHVSGAVLLLKEAFPYLSGEELLMALYLTAVDLGDPGEDNTYGMGLIDVDAAFQYLANSNLPIDPLNQYYDLAVDSIEILNIGEYSCDNDFSANVYFSNTGDFPINSIEFTLKINSTPNSNYIWNGVLNPSSSAVLNIPSVVISSAGKKEFQVSGSILSSAIEYDYFNNSSIARFSKIGNLFTLPLVEHFENGINDSIWCISNAENDQTWITDSTDGLPWNNLSACIKLYSYSPRANQKDGLLSPLISLSSFNQQLLTFDVAYQQRSQSNVVKDTLKVYVSKNCGESFDNLVYEKLYTELSTFDTVKHNFIPEFSTHWRNDTIDLSQFSNQNILFKFETVNRQGNNLYLDNIKLFEGSQAPVGVIDDDFDFNLYPNPSSENIRIQIREQVKYPLHWTIYNALGLEIQSGLLFEESTSLAISKYSNGIYFLRLYNSNHAAIKSFIKWED
ncbi:MAG: S8 family serine peptidase [Bacteroidota bacterium]|nr:S8 family serine peptidase [Bacteroidota bacterium]